MKPIRLIELFAGYGSQALAMKYLGLPFEHHRICEWAINSIKAYKNLHFPNDHTDYSADFTDEQIAIELHHLGVSIDYNKPATLQQLKRRKDLREIYNAIKASHNMVSVTTVHGQDFRIEDKDKYTYVMTYSFPCQDLSCAGKQKGMSKGSGTRSGLLWEVERILSEMDEKPDILLMENVKQVIGDKNLTDFHAWEARLRDFGYKSIVQVLNSKDYGIPQSRERAFMISVLDDRFVEFPQKIPLAITLKDVRQTDVDEKYYLSDKAVKYICERLGKWSQLVDDETKVAPSAITAKGNANWTGNFWTQSVNVERERTSVRRSDAEGEVAQMQSTLGTSSSTAITVRHATMVVQARLQQTHALEIADALACTMTDVCGTITCKEAHGYQSITLFLEETK